ncbi:MAG: PVC-type heme-binding CxxCH protein [Acidobacteriota bacterium]
MSPYRKAKWLSPIAFTAVMLAVIWTGAGQRATQPVVVKALFLGDNGHHKPADMFAHLKPVFQQRGIEMTYTNNLEDLKSETLRQYSALIVYANHSNISASQQQALLTFVAGGGGFIPLHCASFCFRNSPKYVELVGAQFKSHGTGVFRASIVDPTHPAMEGLEEFEAWDETYVHHQHNPDRHVLMIRDENGRAEPWTWVRNHGKGRVFYTASGHDPRTWSHPGFQRLVEQGIRWAVRSKKTLSEDASLKPLEYTKATVPNYLPDRPGTSAEPLPRMQLPLPPEESIKHIQVPDGFDVKLFASEPDIAKPICMAWDARGRLWIAETVDYPNEMQPEGKGRDRIKICEDTDADGRADKFTVFAEKLSIPTSLAFANGGVIVTQAPHTLFLKDTDGDDRADVRQVLFSGWETWDTHAGPSSLRPGLDNWVWGTVGYSGFKGTVGGKRHEFRQGFFRFRPDGSELEFLGSTSNNTWGLGFSEEGFAFGSTANNQHSLYMGIANRYYESVLGWSSGRIPGIADHWRFYPLREKTRQVDWHDGFTAAAGHGVYTARSYPKAYWNRVAFVCEPTGSLVHNCVVRPQGSHFVSHDAHNLFVSSDEWTAPVAAEVGPDGAVWVLDWYNYIVQHNPTPQGFSTGKGNAYETSLRDKKHGRVYRVIHTGASPARVLNLESAAPDQLVASLRHENLLWRMTAQRLLVERGNKDIVPALVELARDKSVDEIGLNPGALHALWLMQGLDAFGDADSPAASAVVAALQHPAASVRRAALGLLPRTTKSLDAILESGALGDEAPVRLAALLALSEMPPSAKAGQVVLGLLKKPANIQDRWISDAVIAAGARHNVGFLQAPSSGFRLEDEPQTQKQANLIENPSFEEGSGAWPAGWVFRALRKQVEHRRDNLFRTGTRSVAISGSDGASARWSSSAEVKPYTDYLLSAWVKTERLQSQVSLGALVQVQDLDDNVSTPAVTGTSEWKKVETTFNTGAQNRVRIHCVFTASGAVKGTAWYDELELHELGNPLKTRVGRVIEIVAADYATRAPDTVAPVLVSLKNADVDFARSALEGFARGWPAGQSPKLSDQDRSALSDLTKQLPADLREKLLLLAGRWGRNDVFSADVAAVVSDLKGQVANPSLKVDARIGAAQRLIRLDSGLPIVRYIVRQITPATPLRMVNGLLSSLIESPSPQVAPILIGHWKQLTPGARRTAMTVLLRRPAWTAAVLSEIESGRMDYRELNTEQTQQLTLHSDPKIAQRVKAIVAAKGRAADPEREKVVTRLLNVAQQNGDAVRGKVMFEKNCMRCHAFNGVGRNIGPDLTGIGARKRADILVDILDPSRSVEGNYRLWIVTTKDGQLLTGRLDSESQRAVELVDAEEKHVIQRKDIASIRGSRQSIMPDGFETHLSAHELASLLQYLTASNRSVPRRQRTTEPRP